MSVIDPANISLSQLRQELSDYQRKLLNLFWQDFLDTTRWPETFDIYRTYPKDEIHDPLSTIGGNPAFAGHIVEEANDSRGPVFQLSPIGILLTADGPEYEKWFVGLVEFLRLKFYQKKKEGETFEYDDVEIGGALKLNKNQLHNFGEFLRFTGHYQSHGHTIGGNWKITLPKWEIQELSKTAPIGEYCEEFLFKYFRHEKWVFQNDKNRHSLPVTEFGSVVAPPIYSQAPKTTKKLPLDTKLVGALTDMNKAIGILEELRNRIPSIKQEDRQLRSPKFLKWQLDTQTAIEKIFPDNEGHVHRFNNINYRTSAYHISTSVADVATAAFVSGMEEADAILQSLTDEINKFWTDGVVSPISQHTAKVQNPKTVFVVHGRNEALRSAMFAFLRAIGLHPLEWSQAIKATGEATPYVGQILDKAFSMAQAVVVLMTPDDEACLRKQFQTDHDEPHEKNPTGQARPNVLFEAGMAMGRDVKRTVLVEVGKLRPFSDVGGRHILRLNNTSERRQDLADRLKTAGCDVDLTGRDWHTAGAFELKEFEQSHLPNGGSPVVQNVKITLSNSAESISGLTVAEAEIIAATPDHGCIHIARSSDHGQIVISGKGDFFDEKDPSRQAKYVDALESLLGKRIIRSDGQDSYRLTGRGYEICKALKVAGLPPAK